MRNEPQIDQPTPNLLPKSPEKKTEFKVNPESLPRFLETTRGLLGKYQSELVMSLLDNGEITKYPYISNILGSINDISEKLVTDGMSFDEYRNTDEFEEKFAELEDARKRLKVASNIELILVEESKKDSEKEQKLRGYQEDALDAIKDFLLEGKSKGYLSMPTGTGKTVLFSYLLKALDMTHDDEDLETLALMKSMILVPKKDLIKQTQGHSEDKSGKVRGIEGFASDLNVGVYYGKIKNLIGDTVITTYSSFNLAVNEKYEIGTLKKDDFGRDFNDEDFNLIVCDEAHLMLGEVTERNVDRISDGKIEIGFTATPEYAHLQNGNRIVDKSLENSLGQEIYHLELLEAIKKGFLQELDCRTITTEYDPNQSIKLNKKDLKGEEFSQNTYDKMMALEVRNNQAVEETVKLIESGRKGIISCIPGRDNSSNIDSINGRKYNGEAGHARLIAERVSEQMVRDAKTGKMRYAKAEFVYGKLDEEERERIYEGFEKGDIDCICFVDLIKEGWDSDVAKFLINLRPTKSECLAKQRLGRILRKWGNLKAVVVEFIDQVTRQAEPMTVQAIFGEETENFDITASGESENSGGGGSGRKGPSFASGFEKGVVTAEDILSINKETIEKPEPEDRYYSIEELESLPKEDQGIIIKRMLERNNPKEIEDYIYSAVKNKIEVEFESSGKSSKSPNGNISGFPDNIGKSQIFIPIYQCGNIFNFIKGKKLKGRLTGIDTLRGSVVMEVEGTQ